MPLAPRSNTVTAKPSPAAAADNRPKQASGTNEAGAGYTPDPGGKQSASGPALNSESITPETINARWHEVLAKVKKYNHSLVFILRACQPRSVSNNVLNLVFKYKFHKERIRETNIKKMVESVLKEVYGQPLMIETEIDESLELGVNTPKTGENGEARENDSEAQEEGQPQEQAAAEQPQQSNDNNKQDNQNDNNPMVDNLLKTFGGRVVE